MKIKNKNILTFTLLCSFVTLTLQGRPGPGSGDYPAEGTGFVKGDDWDNDTTGITFLNKWRAQQQQKTSPAKKPKTLSPTTDREALHKKLMADFQRLLNDVEANSNGTNNTTALKSLVGEKTIIESDTETDTQTVTHETEEIVRGIVDSAA